MAAPLPPHVHINLDSKLGAAFLGNLAAGIFYGITCVQAYTYYRRGFKDSFSFKLLIGFTWALDTLHLALITHALYYYMISNYGNLVAIASPTWSILSQIYVTCITDLTIRGIFGRRAWLLSGRNMFFAAGITITALITFVTGFVFASQAFHVGTYDGFSKISSLLYTALAGGVVADIILAVVLCASLLRSRTGFQKTDSVVNTLMLYTVNSTLLTTVCSALSFITYAIWPHEFTFIGIYFSLPKLFFNSLLATLNAREDLKERMGGVSGVALSDLSSRRDEYSSKESYHSRLSRQPPIAVTINRHIEVDTAKTPTFFPKGESDVSF